MVNYAFPELHPTVSLYDIVYLNIILIYYFQTQLKPPSKNLLIYNRSGVDSSGRRHSVSIPLLPSSTAKPNTTVISIQRKESQKGERGRGRETRRRIREREGRLSTENDNKETDIADTSTPMDCLAVPASNCTDWQQTARRKSSLPVRKRSTSSERGSSRRSSKQGIETYSQCGSFG